MNPSSSLQPCVAVTAAAAMMKSLITILNRSRGKRDCVEVMPAVPGGGALRAGCDRCIHSKTRRGRPCPEHDPEAMAKVPPAMYLEKRKDEVQAPMMKHRLSDEQMVQFLMHGFLVLPPDPSLPASHHRRIFEHCKRLELHKRSNNPGNNILALVPGIREIMESVTVDGALSSVLGDGYRVHGHRYCHSTQPGSGDQVWHKDAYASGYQRRQHRPRWAMIMYYPQEVTLDMGPTGVIAGSHYLGVSSHRDLIAAARMTKAHCSKQGGEGGVGPAPGPPEAFGEKMRVCVKAGSCILIHFDIWHRGTRNISKDKLRYMFKMQAVRMNEPLPDNPSWNSNYSSLSKFCVIKQQHQLQQPQQQQKASLPRIPKMDPVWEAMWSYLNQKQSQSSGTMDDDDDAETIAGAAKMGGENEQDCKANRGPYDDALDHRHFCQLKRDLYESLYVDRHPCRGTHECVGVVAKGSPKSHTTAHHLEGIVSKEIRAMNAAYILARSYGNRGASTLMSAALSPDQAHCRAAAAASRRSAVALASLHSQQDTILELGLITRLAKAICGEGQSLGISTRAKDHHNQHQEASSAPPSSSSPCVETTSVAGARETACFIAGEWASIYASLLRSSSSSLSARKSTNDDHQGKEKPTEGEQNDRNRRRLVDDIIGALASALSKRDECSLVRIAAAEALGSIGNMLAISFCRSSCRSHKEEQKEHKECALPDNNDSYSPDLAAKLIIRRIERCLGDVIRTEMVNESPPPPLPPSSSSSSSSSSSAGGGTMCPQLLQFAVGSLARLGKQASGSVELLAAVAATSSDRYARNTALEALKRLGETERLASQLMWERFCPLTAVDNAY